MGWILKRDMVETFAWKTSVFTPEQCKKLLNMVKKVN